MIKDLKILLFLFISAALFSACTSGGVDPNNSNGGGGGHGGPEGVPDTTAPVLTIVTPIDNQVFSSGNTINVTGTITDETGLYRGTIRITNDANGFVLKEQAYEIHYVLGYNFNISYTALVSTPSDYTVTVSFEDHGSHVTTKSVKIKVNP